MVIDNQKELEALLNEAAERYDAPDMAQMAEYLVDNGVVVAPCKIGDEIYSLVHLDDEDRTIIDTLTVTEVGQRYIFCSAYNPPRDDITEEISLDRIGKDVFLSRTDAEMAEKGAIPSEEKEVEELARAMCSFSKNTLCRECSDACFYKDYAKRAIDKGWRKQSEGEWHFYSDYFSGKQVTGWTCGNCNKYSTGIRNYCPECGAKMKGGAG